MLKTEKIDVADRRSVFDIKPLIQKMEESIVWYIATVADRQQSCLNRHCSFSVHIVATAPKPSPPIVNVREKLKVD